MSGRRWGFEPAGRLKTPNGFQRVVQLREYSIPSQDMAIASLRAIKYPVDVDQRCAESDRPALRQKSAAIGSRPSACNGFRARGD